MIFATTTGVSPAQNVCQIWTGYRHGGGPSGSGDRHTFGGVTDSEFGLWSHLFRACPMRFCVGKGIPGLLQTEGYVAEPAEGERMLRVPLGSR